MGSLTLDNIQQYLLNTNVSDVSGCTAPLIPSVTDSTITDIDTFLLKQIESNTRSYTRKENFRFIQQSIY